MVLRPSSVSASTTSAKVLSKRCYATHCHLNSFSSRTQKYRVISTKFRKTKAAECVTVVLQEERNGATWMLEDAYAKHKHWHKLIYRHDQLDRAVKDAAASAEKFVSDFADYQ